MFTKKYIFETKNTRYLRYLKNSLLFLMLLFIFYIISGFILIRLSDQENKRSKQELYKKNPDMIVVFTGDHGRIAHAFKLAKHYSQSNILITGVYSKNTVESIINKNNLTNLINTDLLEIDYLAKNTVENVIYTLRHLNNKPEVKSILIVSHDYHLTRIKATFNKLIESKKDLKIYYSGLGSEFNNLRSIKILYKEVFKLFRSYIFLMLWEKEITQ